MEKTELRSDVWRVCVVVIVCVCGLDSGLGVFGDFLCEIPQSFCSAGGFNQGFFFFFKCAIHGFVYRVLGAESQNNMHLFFFFFFVGF